RFEPIRGLLERIGDGAKTFAWLSSETHRQSACGEVTEAPGRSNARAAQDSARAVRVRSVYPLCRRGGAGDWRATERGLQDARGRTGPAQGQAIPGDDARRQ